jgi:hypothetical protein
MEQQSTADLGKKTFRVLHREVACGAGHQIVVDFSGGFHWAWKPEGDRYRLGEIARRGARK